MVFYIFFNRNMRHQKEFSSSQDFLGTICHPWKYKVKVGGRVEASNQNKPSVGRVWIFSGSTQPERNFMDFCRVTQLKQYGLLGFNSLMSLTSRGRFKCVWRDFYLLTVLWLGGLQGRQTKPIIQFAWQVKITSNMLKPSEEGQKLKKKTLQSFPKMHMWFNAATTQS